MAHLGGSIAMDDRFAGIRGELERGALTNPGETTPELRAAAARNQGLPEELRALVDKIHHHAYRVTDEDVAALRGRYSDDQLFEVLVAATVGASGARLDQALAVIAAMNEAKDAAAQG
jgi:hypothetical protein